jgi:hypothetical protein
VFGVEAEKTWGTKEPRFAGAPESLQFSNVTRYLGPTLSLARCDSLLPYMIGLVAVFYL